MAKVAKANNHKKSAVDFKPKHFLKTTSYLNCHGSNIRFVGKEALGNENFAR